MAAERELAIKITGDTRGLGRAFGQVNTQASKMERGLGGLRRGFAGLAKGAAAASAVVAAAGVAFAKVGIDEALEQEKVAARTANVIKTTGGAAKVTAGHVADLAGALQEATGSADDQIQAGANLILTFKNIRNEAGKGNDVFDQTVAIANDMSVALGTDMEQSSMQLGKALNDPIRGLTQLRRVGVSFTEQQSEQIKAMVESGDVLGAQKIMLKELESQFGGAAKAEGPLTEAWQSLRRTFEDVAEGALQVALPAITALVDAVKLNVVPALGAAAEVITPLVQSAFTQIVPVVQNIVARVGQAAAGVVSVVKANWPQIQSIATQVFGALSGIVTTVVGAVSAAMPRITEAVRNVLAAVGPIVASIARLIADLAPKLKPAISEIGRIVGSLADLIGAVARRVMQLWDKFGDEIIAVVKFAFEKIVPIIKPILATIRSVIETITALIEGDWSGVWNGLKGIAANALKAVWAVIRGAFDIALTVAKELGERIVKGLGNALKGVASAVREGVVGGLRRLGDLGTALLNKGIEFGKKIVTGLVDYVTRELPSKLAGAVAGALGGLAGGAGDAVRSLLGLAGGGMIPGTYQGRDTMVAAVAPGEAVLTPTQQAMLPGGRGMLMEIFRRTGGRIGGSSFARGGIAGAVQAAKEFAAAQVGEPYSNAARLGPSSWDCSGFAGTVASKIPGFTGGVGGTTVTYAASSTPASGNEPVVFGFRSFGSDQWVRNNWRHMGIRVGGTWFDAGSGGVEQGDSRWDKLMVPAGLAGLAAQMGDPSQDPEQGPPSRTRQVPELSDRQKLARTLGQAVGRAGLVGAGKGIAKWAGPLVGALSTDVPDVSGGLSGTSYSGPQSRAISGAARAARTAARRAGQSPEEVRAAGEDAERAAELKVLRQNRRAIIQARAKLRKKKKRLLANWKRLTRSPAKTPKARAARRKATAEIKAKLREYTAEINDCTEMIAEVAERMAELNEQAVEAQHEANYAAGEDAGDGGVGDGGDGDVDLGPTAGDFGSAALAQAALTEGLADDLAAAEAEELRLHHAYNAATYTGDPRLIGPAAQALLSARQTVKGIKEQIAAQQPTELDRLNLRAVEAQFTDDLGDDLQVAKDLEAYYQREVDKARATGEPRLIATALQALLSARQSREAIEENTGALKDNTDAVKGMAGSLTFAYRGQGYVLGSLAAPSSDRIENLAVGV